MGGSYDVSMVNCNRKPAAAGLVCFVVGQPSEVSEIAAAVVVVFSHPLRCCVVCFPCAVNTQFWDTFEVSDFVLAILISVVND